MMRKSQEYLKNWQLENISKFPRKHDQNADWMPAYAGMAQVSFEMNSKKRLPEK
ncbi:MAG: hypothetical protein AB1403_13805 [Candidatus Riflebacteria bacterium]